MITGSIAVAVINHDTCDHLRRCLISLLDEEPAETLVVDTGSMDGSAEMARREFPAATLHVMPNRGFGAGVNTALGITQCDYVLVLNADTRVECGAIRTLSAYLDDHPRVAVVGPRIVNEAGNVDDTGRHFPTPLELLMQETGIHTLLSARRSDRSPGRVDWVLGAALAVRRQAVLDVGGFDESYFMYGEEVDLSLRLRAARWETHYAPVATVVHVGGASTSQRPAAMTAQYVRSTILLYRRHRTPLGTLAARAVLGLALAARLLRDSVRLRFRRERDERENLAVRVDAWRHALRAALRDRPP